METEQNVFYLDTGGGLCTQRLHEILAEARKLSDQVDPEVKIRSLICKLCRLRGTRFKKWQRKIGIFFLIVPMHVVHRDIVKTTLHLLIHLSLNLSCRWWERILSKHINKATKFSLGRDSPEVWPWWLSCYNIVWPVKRLDFIIVC